MDTSINDKVALFAECFLDSTEVARKLFLCRDVVTVSIYEDKRLAAMASLVPILAEAEVYGYYIYGVCVDRKYRGRGLFRDIMQKAESEALKMGATFVCLIPADKALSNTYRKFGYDTEVVPYNMVGEKKISLESESFRRFARCDMEESVSHKDGLLKSLKKDIFSPKDREFYFADDMGDI